MVQMVLRERIKSMRVEITCEGRTKKYYGVKLQGKRLSRKIQG